MKTIKANFMENHFTWLNYEVNGKDFNVNGDFFYNDKKKRFEHVHIGPRGGEYLVVYPHVF